MSLTLSTSLLAPHLHGHNHTPSSGHTADMSEPESAEVAVEHAKSESLAGPSKYAATTQSSSSPPDFSSSLSIWREVDLPVLQNSLETLCPTLISSQKDALLSRKRLAEQTREFKKLSIESQGEAIKPLLKSYQSEIDSLTKRAKSAENAVLSVRDRLQTATDPYPILEAVLVSMRYCAGLVGSTADHL
ncbi:hypothetical protein L7F22_017000 [Adiantum nelumboides]|nr:hypothetical protein [Adiantum nelumboides]